MSADLEKLDYEIAKAYKERKSSLFKASFEFLNESVKQQLENSSLLLRYLRIACFLQDFYDRSDGQNFRTMWSVHNKDVNLDETWKHVYNRPVNQYEVKSKVWILSEESHGKASDIWRVIKACASKKSEDGAYNFDWSSYINDGVPQQLKLILDNYQRGGVDGAEFVSFIEAFQRKGKECDEWMTRLVGLARKHFPSCLDFTAAGYLKWDGDGTVQADIILGIDHVQGVLSGCLDVDGKKMAVTIAAGFKGFSLPSTGSDRHKVIFKGVELEEIPASPVGVYYRYQLGDGARRSWWKRVRSDDGMFPYNRKEILLVFPDGYNGGVDFGHDVAIESVKRTRVSCSGNPYLFVAARIKSRSETGCKVNVGDMTINFAGISPAIRLETDTAQSIWAEDAVVVDATTSVKVDGLTDSMSCTWTINGNDVFGDGCSLKLPNPQGGFGESRVEATIREKSHISKHLSINVFHVPFEIAEALRSDAALPYGWSLEQDKDREDCIALRVAGRRAASLVSPNNVVLPIYVKDRSCAWWIERDYWDEPVKDSFRAVSQFTRMSDLEGARLCIPADMAKPSLTVSGKPDPIPDSKWQPGDGVIQISLDDIVGDPSGCEFRFGGNASSLEFFLDGQKVGAVAAVPNKPTLCRHADSGELGVFLPKRTKKGTEKFLVLAYRDTVSKAELYDEPEQLTADPLEWKYNEEDRFVSVAPKLNAYLEKHQRGEVFLVLTKEKCYEENLHLVISSFFLKPKCGCQISVVRTDSSSYTKEETAVVKQLKSLWSDDLSLLPDGHPLKRMRISLFEGAFKYEECGDYWRGVAACPPKWKTAFRVMLDSGYNPLMEPDWFNQSVDELIDKVRSAQGSSRVTDKHKKEVLKVLLDNKDAKDDKHNKGKGLCAALVSRRQIRKYSDPVPTGREALFFNREQSVLSKKVADLGINGVFECRAGMRYLHKLRSASGGEIVFSSNEVLKRCCRSGLWRRTDDKKKLLSFKEFEFESSGPNNALKLSADKTADIDPENNEWALQNCSEAEYQSVIDVGIKLSRSLDCPWMRELFEGTFTELKRKGCCDVAVARAIGLVVCIQSILGDKKREKCLKAVDDGYDLVLRLTRSMFCRKFDAENNFLWRETMRFIAAFLGINAYLDISPDAILDNNF